MKQYFSRVALFRKLPKTMEALWYSIPESLFDTATMGRLVKVKLGNFTTFGIIIEVTTKAPQLKTIHPLISCCGWSLPPELVETLMRSSDYFVTSASSLLKALIPTPPVHHKNPPRIQSALTKPKFQTESVTATTEEQMTRFVIERIQEHTKRKESTLILVPNLKDLEIFQKQLHEKNIVYVGGKQGKIASFEDLKTAESGKAIAVIGTRRACLLPLHNLAEIIIYREESSDHKQWDMNPRYDARTVCSFRAARQGLKLTFLSEAPRVSTVKRTANHLRLPRLAHPEYIVEVNKRTDQISPQLEETLIELREEKKTIAVVTEPDPNLPKELLEQAKVFNLYQAIEDKSFEWQKFDSVILWHPERALFSPEWSSEERLRTTLIKLRNKLGPQATLTVVVGAMHRVYGAVDPNQDQIWRDEILKERKENGEPPFGAYIKLISQSASLEQALKIAQNYAQEIPHHQDLIVMGPYEAYPNLVRGRYRAMLALHGSPETLERYKPLLRAAPEEILIDIDPERLFR